MNFCDCLEQFYFLPRTTQHQMDSYEQSLLFDFGMDLSTYDEQFKISYFGELQDDSLQSPQGNLNDENNISNNPEQLDQFDQLASQSDLLNSHLFDLEELKSTEWENYILSMNHSLSIHILHRAETRNSKYIPRSYENLWEIGKTVRLSCSAKFNNIFGELLIRLTQITQFPEKEKHKARSIRLSLYQQNLQPISADENVNELRVTTPDSFDLYLELESKVTKKKRTSYKLEFIIEHASPCNSIIPVVIYSNIITTMNKNHESNLKKGTYKRLRKRKGEEFFSGRLFIQEEFGFHVSNDPLFIIPQL